MISRTQTDKGTAMDGTVDYCGMRLSWRLIEGQDEYTLHVDFGVLSTSRTYKNVLGRAQAESEAAKLAPLVFVEARAKDHA
jgi:hypothetical protein